MNLLWLVTLSLAAFVVCVGCLYCWAGVCFVFFRCSRAENEARFRRFLEDHYEFYCQRAFSPPLSEVTRHEMKRVAWRGWGMITLPMILLGQEFNLIHFLLANGIVFFGGLGVAYSWYGSRCMRALNLETVKKLHG